MASGISFRLISIFAAMFFLSCGSTSDGEAKGTAAADTAKTVVPDTTRNIKEHLAEKKADTTPVMLSEAKKAQLSKDAPMLRQYRAILAENFPRPQNWVNDYDNLFTGIQEEEMNNIISKFEKESGMQIAVVTLDTFSFPKDEVSGAGLKIFNGWGIGTKEKNDGLLIMVVKGQGYMRINTGKGTQQILSDATADSIMRAAFFPSFQKENFYKGTLTGLKALIAYLRPNVDKIK